MSPSSVKSSIPVTVIVTSSVTSQWVSSNVMFAVFAPSSQVPRVTLVIKPSEISVEAKSTTTLPVGWVFRKTLNWAVVPDSVVTSPLTG